VMVKHRAALAASGQLGHFDDENAVPNAAIQLEIRIVA
jgi:hypothetical protein